jgi:hypothetical protein
MKENVLRCKVQPYLNLVESVKVVKSVVRMAWESIICWKLYSGKSEEHKKLYAPLARLNF